MTKDKSDRRTDDLFHHIPAPVEPSPGSLDMGTEVCMALSEAIKRSPHSRPMIAARMSDLTGADISTAMLNSWTALSHDRHRFPLEYAAAFEVATESTALQELLARKRGAMVLMGPEALDAKMGRIQREKQDLLQQEKELRALQKRVRR